MTNAERFQWLATRPANSIHLGCNDEHACNYMTAAAWIIDELAEKDSEFHDCTSEEIAEMGRTNIIWSLQIYPSTPIGSYRWFAPTMAGVIDKAIAAWPEIQRNYPGVG